MSWSIKLGFSLFFVVLILLQSDFPAALPMPAPWHGSSPTSDPTEVVLINNIGAVLVVHSKSKDDNIGFHALLNGERWQFSFNPNFFGSTLFYASFKWHDQFHYFDVYKESRDVRFKKIYWSVTTTGLCRLVGTEKECFPWNT